MAKKNKDEEAPAATSKPADLAEAGDSMGTGKGIAADAPSTPADPEPVTAETELATAPADPEPDAAPAAEPELRTDGPTLEEFLAAGYKAELYPPSGYAARTEARVRYYRVDRLAKYCTGGYVYTLNAGSIVSTTSHDLADVRAQGVPLTEVDAADLPAVQSPQLFTWGK